MENKTRTWYESVLSSQTYEPVSPRAQAVGILFLEKSIKKMCKGVIQLGVTFFIKKYIFLNIKKI